MNALVQFQPSIQQWFETQFERPTDVQAKSWPLIAAGKHVLITAPTGSGKTLTAFLWSLNQFASGTWEPGRTRVIYVSPLKALNNDIQRNLLGPLSELRENHNFPAISVQTRSGDTTPNERQKMLRRPPDVLITTPESLSLLLTTSKGRHALSTVETVILDEIHAIVDNRRGVQLMTSIERLAHIAGEFQRLALSATIRPLEAVASYVGGYLPDGSPRSLEIVSCQDDKKIQFHVRFPEEAKQAAENGKKIWDPLADSFREVIDHNRATLFFTNSRRLAEKITLKINEDQPVPLAYAHNGSLARDIRNEVESRLKAGQLRAIVATNTLEMGIDIGHLDEVVMVQSPPSVASALQ
ncbi:MAG: DEAD/DEAH box helicase, partial [Gammaproteobacteria bacterium]|nr:DEAD/DEAH box helicase [Gammaproteobacteria bacterium]